MSVLCSYEPGRKEVGALKALKQTSAKTSDIEVGYPWVCTRAGVLNLGFRLKCTKGVMQESF